MRLKEVHPESIPLLGPKGKEKAPRNAGKDWHFPC